MSAALSVPAVAAAFIAAAALVEAQDAPSPGEQCDASTPCPSLHFCDSDWYGVQLCQSCMDVKSAGPLACDSLWGREAKEQCLSECSSVWSECSDDAQCPNESFCAIEKRKKKGYDDEESPVGYCFGCERVGDPLTCFDIGGGTRGWYLSEASQDSCASKCFPECDGGSSCVDGSFCNYQLTASDGYCSDCALFSNKGECSASPLTEKGSESCRDTCFGCSADDDCQGKAFCDLSFGDKGHCTSCSESVDGNPFRCMDSNVVPSVASRTCLDTCSEQCSSANPCGNGSDTRTFCAATADDNGYCMDCEALMRNNPLECLDLELSDESQSLCLSTCFTECSIKMDFDQLEELDPDCSLCIQIDATSDQGYCEPFNVGYGMSSTSCKFCPELTPLTVETQVEGDGSVTPGVNATIEVPKEITDERNSTKEGLPPASLTNDTELPLPAGGCQSFCPNNDVLYPEREINTFEYANCSLLNEWVPLNLEPNSRDCRLAAVSSYICGCSGLFYAGANSQAKRAALVWVPRVMAILSIIGSSIIIFDIAHHRQRRAKVFGQIMILLSVFDLLSSIAYSFTSLPTPSEDYVYGSRGSYTSCQVQAFFISMSGVACYTNVSLSFYYHFMLVRGWSEAKIKRQARAWLIAIPLIIGFAFSFAGFAGIPFYDSHWLWCSNTGLYWPESPIILAMIVASSVMVAICVHVHRNEKRSAKYTGSNRTTDRGKSSKTSMVLSQSISYLTSFYLVWPPYVALQWSWAAGISYDSYWLTLIAGSLVPLQGFFNCVTYLRPRIKNRKIARGSSQRIKGFWKHLGLRYLSEALTASLFWGGGRSSSAGENNESANEAETAEEEKNNESSGENKEAGISNDLTEYTSLFCNESEHSEQEGVLVPDTFEDNEER